MDFVYEKGNSLTIHVGTDSRIVLGPVWNEQDLVLNLPAGIFSFQGGDRAPGLIVQSVDFVLHAVDSEGVIRRTPWGTGLISATRGRITVQTTDGLVFFAEPGSSVGFDGQNWEMLSHDHTCTHTFHRNWYRSSHGAFLQWSGESLEHWVRKYQESRLRFLGSYNEFLAYREYLVQWITQDDRSGAPVHSLDPEEYGAFRELFFRLTQDVQEFEALVELMSLLVWENMVDQSTARSFTAQIRSIEDRFAEFRHIQSVVSRLTSQSMSD